jgi:hypothetical protein
MKVHEVKTTWQVREFLKLPLKLYKNEPNWIQPLEKDITLVFDPAKNKFFTHGECIRWIIQNDSGETIGRVAAFIDQKTMNKGNDQPTGGMGFFECVHNQQVAFALFDLCKAWLRERGAEAMDGPINFGPRDRWWGLLIEGFDQEPNYQCNYNFPYYQDFFEAYGFQVYFYQLTYGRKLMGPLSEKLWSKSQLVSGDSNYSFDYFKGNDFNKLSDDIRSVYNRAWAKRGEMAELSQAQTRNMVKQMKPIMDKHLVWFGYYKGEPIGFFISIPELNQIFKYLHGKLNLIGKLKFLWHQWRKTNKKAFGILFGVVPEHHGKGVDGGMILGFRKLLQEEYLRYEDYEFGWIGDFNPKMMRVSEQVQTEIVKRHATYRKLFDENKQFKRMPIVG